MPLIPESKEQLRGLIAWLRRKVRRGSHTLDRDDAIQDILYRSLLTPRDRVVSSPQAYMSRVARSVVIDHARMSKARGGGVAIFGDLADSAESWVAPDQESALLLKQIILGLPPIYRDTFVLNRIVGLTYGEIAERFGITSKAVEYRMSRALALCAEALKD